MSFVAGGMTHTSSATVDARLYLYREEPPATGTSLPPRITNYSTVLRTGICPGF
jgi:hypothetical protein